MKTVTRRQTGSPAREEEMTRGFELTEKELTDISRSLQKNIQIGLCEDKTEIKCLPTFIPLMDDLKDGQSYVLDLGGSNLRAAVVSFEDGKANFLKMPVKKVMPWKRNEAFPKEQFLSIQAELLAALNYPDECPIGYCFSYPAESMLNRDAKLLNWTKGITVPDTEGYGIGNMLLEYLKSHNKKVNANRISVINDTIASLFAGLVESKTDVYIGLVVGTGTNMATFINAEDIPKLKNISKWHGLTPVNLESGNFDSPHLTHWDREVDKNSENKGAQLFEKAVSGMYLGRIFKSVFPGSNFDSASGAEGLVRMLNAPTGADPVHISGAMKIYERSSKLIAASLAGLIYWLVGRQSIQNIRIVAEGGLFWSEVLGEKYYLNLTKTTLETLLNSLGLPKMEIEFSRIKEANLIGTAIAALS